MMQVEFLDVFFFFFMEIIIQIIADIGFFFVFIVFGLHANILLIKCYSCGWTFQVDLIFIFSIGEINCIEMDELSRNGNDMIALQRHKQGFN